MYEIQMALCEIKANIGWINECKMTKKWSEPFLKLVTPDPKPDFVERTIINSRASQVTHGRTVCQHIIVQMYMLTLLQFHHSPPFQAPHLKKVDLLPFLSAACWPHFKKFTFLFSFSHLLTTFCKVDLLFVFSHLLTSFWKSWLAASTITQTGEQHWHTFSLFICTYVYVCKICW